MVKSEFFESGYFGCGDPNMQSEHVRELEELDRRIEFFATHLAQSRLERRMASMSFDSAPIKCDSSYVDNMCVAAIVEAQRVRAELVNHISSDPGLWDVPVSSDFENGIIGQKMNPVDVSADGVAGFANIAAKKIVIARPAALI